MEYQVDLDTFRGPLDLLLYLVKRNEVDVFDIPIALIAEQYLHYLKVLQVIDVERAGDFLVMASTLMEIKSKSLLPRTAIADPDEEDPRAGLVKQLLEYKQFKDMAALLEERAEQQSLRLPRLLSDRPPAVDAALQPVSQVELWDLVSAFSRLMRDTLTTDAGEVVVDDTPVHVCMAELLERLQSQPRARFQELFTEPRTRGRLVGLFLALLELIKARRIHVEQESPFETIWIALIAPQGEGADGTNGLVELGTSLPAQPSSIQGEP
jgi:segregation and condensation protein A